MGQTEQEQAMMEQAIKEQRAANTEKVVDLLVNEVAQLKKDNAFLSVQNTELAGISQTLHGEKQELVQKLEQAENKLKAYAEKENAQSKPDAQIGEIIDTK